MVRKRCVLFELQTEYLNLLGVKITVFFFFLFLLNEKRRNFNYFSTQRDGRLNEMKYNSNVCLFFHSYFYSKSVGNCWSILEFQG